MVPDRQKVWTDGQNGRTDDAKTISLRLRRGIIIYFAEIQVEKIMGRNCYGPKLALAEIDMGRFCYGPK